MIVAHLALRTFRNIEAAEFALAPSLTVLVGQNGQGKTNLLEGAALVLSRQTLRARHERELVQFGAPGYQLTAVLSDAGGQPATVTRTVWLSPPRRKLDGPIVPVVAFSPDDVAMVKGTPEGRREFMDRLLAQLVPRYGREAARYQRALSQRNRALKDSQADRVLEGFEPLLAEAGAYCWERRAWLAASLAPWLLAVYETIAPHERPALALEAGGVGHPLTALDFAQRLAESRVEDRRRGLTTLGPHRDDLKLAVNGVEARLLSQGQQRSLVLGLKLAARRLVEHELERRPLLVLDDVFSELDGRRRQALLDVVTEPGQQTIIADVDVRAFLPVATKRYVVSAGRVAEAVES